MGDNEALLLQVSADLHRLEKNWNNAVGIVDKGSRAMERRASQSATSLERFFGKPSIPKALDKVFDSTRFKILDTGAARVGLFGSALESLGPIGLTAAAGIGALAAALSEAKGAMSFAHDLQSTANRLHVTTDALQEYRFAIRAVGGDEKGADEALEAFSVTLGKAQAGLTKSKRAFKELNFSDADIKSFKTVDEALKAVTDRISGLKNNQQKDAVIDQLGLTGLKPLIEGGAEAMEHLRQEAHGAGLVMDKELVRRGAAAQEKFETLSKVVDIQLKSAFVDLAPVLLDVLKLASQIAGTIADMVDSFKEIEHRRTSFLEKQRSELVAQVSSLTAREPAAALSGKPGSVHTFITYANKKIDAIDAELASRAADSGAPSIPTGDTSLIDQSAETNKASQQLKQFNQQMAKDAEAILAAMDNERHSAEERADIARQRLGAEEAARKQELADLVATKAITPKQAALLSAKDKEVYDAKRREQATQLASDIEAAHLKAQADLTAATVSALHSQADLAKTAAARAVLNAEALAAEQAQARLEEQKKLADDPNKSPEQKGAELKAFDQSQANAKAAQAAQDAQAVADEALSLQMAGLDGLRDVLQAQLAIATTAKARRDLELKLLDLADQEAKARLEAVLASQTASDAEKKIAQQQLDTLNATAPDRRQDVIRQTNGPLADYIDKLPKSLDEVNERMQALAVEGIEGLNDAIVDLATGTGKASDILRNFLRQMLADFTKLELQQLEGSVFGSSGSGNAGIGFLKTALSFGASLFGPSGASLSAAGASMTATNAALVAAGLADGGHISGPGGPRGDKIPIWASDGEFMVNAAATKKHRALLEAINGGRPLPRYANGGIVNLTNLRLGPSSAAPAAAANWSPTLHVYVQAAAGMTRADARRTGGQIASAAMERLAQARKKGL